MRDNPNGRSVGNERKTAGIALLLLAFIFAGCHRQQPKNHAEQGTSAKTTSQLVHVAQVPLKSARDITFIQDTAYISQNFLGATVVDTSNPASPSVIRTISPDIVQPLHLSALSDEKTLAVADRFRGFVLLNVASDPPTTVAQLAVPGIATHLQVYRDRGRDYAAIACGGSGMTIVDFTDRTSPTITGRYTYDVDYSRNVAVSPPIAALADNFNGGLKLIDISTSKPRLLLKIALPGFYDSVHFRQWYMFAACRNHGTRIFTMPYPGKNADGVTTPAVVELCNVRRSHDRVRDVIPFGRRMIVANDEAGVELYDITNPALPVLLDDWEYSGGGSAMAAVERKGYIYVPSWDAGLHIFQIADSR